MSPGGRASDDKLRLDVGCGRNKRAGAIGIDHNPATDADVLCDLNHFPWPLRDSVFDVVRCRDVIEHLPDTVAVVEELHRVTKPGGLVRIKTPHFVSLESWEDPTHVKHFSAETLEYFCLGTGHTAFYSPCKFELVASRISFGGSGPRLIRWIARRWRRFYERELCFLIRPRSVFVTLRVLKDDADEVGAGVKAMRK